MRDIQRRLVAHLAGGRTTDFANGVMENDVRIYTDPSRLEAERLELFLKQPMVAGLSCDIPKPGDMMLFDGVGPSILITRGKDSKVRAFLNFCRHRGTPVVKDCTNRKLLTCPFHGWTYDLEGRLVGVPGEDAFSGIDRRRVGLVRVPVAEWEGLIFVKARRGEDEIDVEGFLGSMAPVLKQLDLAHSVPVKKDRLDVEANWKFAQDTFFEGYHFATIHPTTIAASTVTNVLVHDQFGRHQRVVYPPNYFMDWIGKPEDDWAHVPYQGVHFIFPNTILFCGHIEGFGSRGQNDRQIYGIWRTFPKKDARESFTLLATYRPIEGTSANDHEAYQEITDFIIKVIAEEDYSLCKSGQNNLDESICGTNLLFGRNEIALQHIHRNIADVIGMPLYSSDGLETFE